MRGQLQGRHTSGAVEGRRLHVGVAGLRRIGRARRLQVAGGVRFLVAGMVGIEIDVLRGGLYGLLIVRARRAVFLDDALRQQIVDVIAMRRFVGREHVVEGAVLAHDDDHVLDRAGRRSVIGMGPAEAGIGRICVRGYQGKNSGANHGAIAQLSCQLFQHGDL